MQVPKLILMKHQMLLDFSFGYPAYLPVTVCTKVVW